ncbi:MAG: T9SS type A sorting domain-containing protein, partial [Chitinophagaceae bacterium]
AFYVTNPFRGGIFKSEIVFEIPAPDPARSTSRSKEPAPVKETMDMDVNVFPTPARDVLNLVFPGGFPVAEGVVSIHRMDGAQLQSVKLSGASTMQVAVSHLPAGVYLLRVVTKTQTLQKVLTITK